MLQCPDDPNIDIHLYNVRFPPEKPGSRVRVNAAKLRLYKRGNVAGRIRITVYWLKLQRKGFKQVCFRLLDRGCPYMTPQ